MTGKAVPVGPVTVGIDWAKDNHAVCVLDAEGEPVARVTIAHTRAGIARLVRMVARYQVSAVGIERPDGPVVEALLAAGFTVFVVPPARIKALRSRYGSAGNKDDRFDAYVLADTMRTDRRRLTPLERDSDPTTALRTMVRARRDLVAHRVAVANQLRAHLDLALPAAVGLFTALDSPISRAFLTTFPTQDALDQLTPDGWGDWLSGQRYSGRRNGDKLYQRIVGAVHGPTGPHAQALAGITRSYVEVLATLMAQIAALAAQIATALAEHPDKKIFTSLPKAGTVRAARLLAEIGDARGRFPTATSLACLAGVAPSTRESGTVHVVSYRWAVDKQLRDAVCDFAGDSHHTNPWAANLYQQARNRGHNHPHAVRILGRAWIDIIWKCWTTNTPYQPDKHRALQHLLNQHQKQGG